jgi:hypothetical protein
VPVFLKSVITGCAALALCAVGLIETSFNRPLLSERPAIAKAKPVVWKFDLPAKRVQWFATKVEMNDVGSTATRTKGYLAKEAIPPIEIDLLVTTLMDLGEANSIWITNPDGVRVKVSTIHQIEDNLMFEFEGPADLLQDEKHTDLPASVILEVHVNGCEPSESRVRCPLVDFSAADLSRDDFERANLRGADLRGVKMDDAKLGGTDFSGALISGTSMRRAWLVAADFSGAFMDQIDFTEAVWTE